jgi:hypothetical protein
MRRIRMVGSGRHLGISWKLLSLAVALTAALFTATAAAQEPPPPVYYTLPPPDTMEPAPIAWQTFPAHMIVGVWDTIVAVNTDQRAVFGLNANDGKELWRTPNFYSPEKAAIFPPVTD